MATRIFSHNKSGRINTETEQSISLELEKSLVLALLLTGCTTADESTTSDRGVLPTFFDNASELESAINNGCLGYKFASGYFKLFVEKEASDNEIYFMAAEMDEVSKNFQNAIYIDEAEGGYQYKRYINYRDLADTIAAVPNQGLNWSLAKEDMHNELLTWCSNWSYEIIKKYSGVNPWSAEVKKPLDSQRKP